MLSPFVECDLGPGLRESEVQVTVRDMNGRPQRLRTERSFVRQENGDTYLPIGIVAQHPFEEKVLIEFPHEADSGANRIWVRPDQLLEEIAAT